LSNREFMELWKLQYKQTEQQIVLRDLETNNSFSALTLNTKYYLVYEAI